MQSSKTLNHLLAVVALVLVAVFMLGSPFSGKTIAPFDMLTRFAGWQSLHLDLPMAHSRHSDVLDYKLPAWRYVRGQLRQGNIPLWNPLLKGGEPAAQMLTRSIITPAFTVYAVLNDEAQGLYFAALVNLLIMSIGAYYLLFRITSHSFAAVIAALVYCYAGFNAGWFYWHHINTSIWIPWLLFFALSYLQGSDKKYLAGVAFSSAAMLLGGFPTVAVYGYIALLFLLLAWLFSSSSKSLAASKYRLLWLLLAGVLSLLMAAFALQPLAEQLARVDLNYRMGGSAFRSLGDLWLFVMPFSQGALTLGRTAYVGLLPLLLLLVGFLFVFRKPYNYLLLWGLALVVLVAPLAFAWIPVDLIRQIPLIGTSMISRLTLIMALGAAIVTAILLAKVYDYGAKKSLPITLGLFAGLFFWQAYDQSTVFKNLIQPVAAEAVYPETPSIRFMQQNIKPLQSVVSDDGFMVSGVLSAYSLAEWYAHGIRNKADKVLLNQAVDMPFVTSTAASFQCEKIRFDEPALDYLAVKYIACARGSGADWTKKVQEKLWFDTAQAHFPVLDQPYVLNRDLPLIQSFDWQDKHYVQRFDIALLSVLPSSSSIQLQLYSEHQLLANSLCELVKPDNHLSCHLDNAIELPQGRYQLRLFLHGEGAENVDIPLLKSPSSHLTITTEQGDINAVLNIRVYGFASRLETYNAVIQRGNDRFVLHQKEPGVKVLENKHVSSSAYYVPRLEYGVSADYSSVQMQRYEPTDMLLRYTGNQPGWLVIPQRLYPGWIVEVNGKIIAYDTFLQSLPAIPVDVGSVVRYYYQPTQWYATATVSIIAWLLFGWMLWRFNFMGLTKVKQYG